MGRMGGEGGLRKGGGEDADAGEGGVGIATASSQGLGLFGILAVVSLVRVPARPV